MCLYRQENYQGDRKCFNSRINLCDRVHGGCHGGWNDKVRSIKFGPNVEYVNIYKHSRFHHFYGKITTSSPKLSWNDATSFALALSKPNPPPPVAPAPDNQVCLYLKPNYQGARKCFSSKIDLCHRAHGGCNGGWNDKVRSIKLGRYVKSVKVYRRHNYKGYYGRTGSSAKLRWKDVTSLIIIRHPPAPVPHNQVCLYLKPNYQGTRKCFSSRINLCDRGHGGCHGAWNDKVRSIKLGRHVSGVKVYKHSGYKHYYGVSGSSTNFRWRDATSFIIGSPPAPAPAPAPSVGDNQICLYLKTNYQGSCKCFDSRINLCDGAHGGCRGPWNDKVRSIKLGKNVKSVKVYKHSGYHHYYGVTGSSANFKWRDATSFSK